MKVLKLSIKIFVLASLLSLTACKDKYPDLEDGMYAEFVTNKGIMVAKLYYDKVPVAVANFVALAEGTHPQVTDSLKGKRFYDGLTFHRVMDKFMIQGGDPTATGSGSPGYKFFSEFDKTLKHDKAGILSMANSGGLNTNGSQFFITEVPYPSLDTFDSNGNLKACDAPRVSCHTVFGELVLGIEVQDTISNVKAVRTKPVEAVVINQLNIIRKGKEAKAFNAAKVFTEEEPNLAAKHETLKEEGRKSIKEKAKVAADNFLKTNADVKGTVKKLPTGLIMIHTENPNGKKPTTEDKVLVDCAGYFEDGNIFYTTLKRVAEANNIYDERAEKAGAYKPFAMPYNETATLVPGFREAMLNMNVGDKARVFIPSYLGYGEQGRAPRVPPNANLVFDIEIVDIAK